MKETMHLIVVDAFVFVGFSSGIQSITVCTLRAVGVQYREKAPTLL